MSREERGISFEAGGMPHSLLFAAHSPKGMWLNLEGIRLSEHILRAEDLVVPRQRHLRFIPERLDSAVDSHHTMHTVAVRQEPPSQDAQETATGLGISTDRRAPPSHPASSISPRIPPRQSPSSLTDEVFQPGEWDGDRSPWLIFSRPGMPEGAPDGCP